MADTTADRDSAAALLTACRSDLDQVSPLLNELEDNGRLPYVTMHLAALVLSFVKQEATAFGMTDEEYLRVVLMRLAVTDIPPLD